MIEIDSPWNLTICARAVHPIICYKLVTRFLGGMLERASLTIATQVARCSEVHPPLR